MSHFGLALEYLINYPSLLVMAKKGFTLLHPHLKTVLKTLNDTFGVFSFRMPRDERRGFNVQIFTGTGKRRNETHRGADIREGRQMKASRRPATPPNIPPPHKRYAITNRKFGHTLGYAGPFEVAA